MSGALGTGRRPSKWTQQQKPHSRHWVSMSQRKGGSLSSISHLCSNSLCLTVCCQRGLWDCEPCASIFSGLMSAQGHHGTDGCRRVDGAGNPEERPSRQNECVLCDTHVRDAVEWGTRLWYMYLFPAVAVCPALGPAPGPVAEMGPGKKWAWT